MDEQTADFFSGADISETPSDAPILMGPPPVAEDDNDFMMDFASTPAPPVGQTEYIGEIIDHDEGVAQDVAEDEVLILSDPNQPYDGAPAVYEEIGDLPPPTNFAVPGGTFLPLEPTEEPPTDMPIPIEDTIKKESPLAKWNNEWQVILRERKDAENAAKAAQAETARKEHDMFLEELEAKRKIRMSSNRANEESKLKSMEQDLENDNSWERVVKLVELTQDSVEKSAEIKRMRDMLILLKNDKERAIKLS